jgi:hypothetical protein
MKWSSKGKVILIHAMKAYTGNRGTAPLILHLSAGWVGSRGRRDILEKRKQMASDSIHDTDFSQTQDKSSGFLQNAGTYL